MKIFYSRYTLEARAEFSGIYQSSEGVLIKFVDEDDTELYSLYHPIEALGDPSLNVFLDDQEVRGRLIQKIQKLTIRQDEQLAGEIPSYCLAPSFSHLFKNADKMASSGFKRVKLKAAALSEIKVSELSAWPFNYILDFNGREKVQSFEESSTEIKSFLMNRVDYIEDPYVEVQKLDFSLASDFIDYGDLADVVVVKPSGFFHKAPAAVSKPSESDKIVVTSYLDHPLGQLLCAKQAQNLGVVKDCGLWTHELYTKNDYSELFSESSKIDLALHSDFISLLQKEKWKEL